MDFAEYIAKKVSNARARIVNVNELHAVVAAGVLASNAEGGISEAEIVALKKTIFANTGLSGFPESTKGTLIDTFADKIMAGAFSGKRALKAEIEKIAGDREVAVRVFDAACDVAAQGGTSEPEKAVLREIAGWLNISDLSEYGL